MPQMKIQINVKTGNVKTEMFGFVDQACLTKAQEIIEKLKAQGIGVDLDTFHVKAADCDPNLVHVAEKATSGK